VGIRFKELDERASDHFTCFVLDFFDFFVEGASTTGWGWFIKVSAWGFCF
jgi:hypothetical protein